MVVFVPTDNPEDSLLLKKMSKLVAGELQAHGMKVVTTAADLKNSGRSADLVSQCSVQKATGHGTTSGSSGTIVTKKGTYSYDTPPSEYDYYKYELVVRLVTVYAIRLVGDKAGPACGGTVRLSSGESEVDSLCAPMIKALFDSFPNPTDGVVTRPLTETPRPRT